MNIPKFIFRFLSSERKAKAVREKGLKAFTLIELLVVVAIIGILAAMIFVSMGSAQASARDGRRQSELSQTKKSLQAYYLQNGRYPTTTEDGISLELDSDTNGTFSQAMKASGYMSIIPRDPLYSSSGGEYTYKYIATTTGSYILAAKKETGDGGYFTADQGSGSGIVQTDDVPWFGSGGGWTCGSPFAYAGQDYSTAQIGGHCWFTQNLNVGTMVANAVAQDYNCPSSAEIEKWCYEDSSANCTSDGGLYTWYQATCNQAGTGIRGICPEGWHIPTHNEWTDLERAVCTSGTCAADFPYDLTTSGLRGTNEGTILRTGLFSAISAGNAYGRGEGFGNRVSYGFFWSSTGYFWIRRTGNYQPQSFRADGVPGTQAFSVRCLQN